MPSSSQPRLALCLEYSLFAFGGTEVLVAELLRGLAPYFALTLVSADRSLAGTWAEDCVAGHIPWLPGDDVAGAGAALARELRTRDVRLAHFHGGDTFAWHSRRLGQSPILRVNEAGIPCLFTNHGFFSPLLGYCAHYRPLWMRLALFPAAWLSQMQLLRAVRREIAVSRYDQRQLRFWYWPCAGKIGQIYHSQLHEHDQPGGWAEGRRKTILCVGTFGFRKGQPVLAEAFGQIAARYPEWELLFAGRIGEPEVWEETQRVIAERGLTERVRRLEGLSHDEIAELMRTSAVFVMPSLYEGLGLSLQEALFHGCACVAAHSGGPEDLLTDGENGLLLPRGDPAALAAALERVLASESLRREFSERGPASVLAKGMTAEAMVHAYQACYQEIMPA